MHLFELYGDPAAMRRNAAAEWFAEGGPAAGRAASGGDGNAGVGERRADMSSGLTHAAARLARRVLARMEWTWSFTVASVMDRARAICWVRHAFGYQGGDLAFAGASVVNSAGAPGR